MILLVIFPKTKIVALWLWNQNKFPFFVSLLNVAQKSRCSISIRFIILKLYFVYLFLSILLTKTYDCLKSANKFEKFQHHIYYDVKWISKVNSLKLIPAYSHKHLFGSGIRKCIKGKVIHEILTEVSFTRRINTFY